MNAFGVPKPYVFRPARYSPLLSPIFGIAARGLLRRVFRVHAVHVKGAAKLKELARSGASVLVTPNHADHADPSVLFLLGRQHGAPFHFMAARQGFDRSPLRAFALSRCGAFSVDRDGADISAIKTAIKILQNGAFPLVVFPEGEIYHHHERLDALNDGASTILLRAANRLPHGGRAYLIPAAIQYRWAPSVASEFAARLDRLEERIIWKPRRDRHVVDRIYRLGNGLLAVKEVEFLGSAQSGTIPERLAGLRNELVASVERKHLGKESHGNIPERVRTLRSRIHKQMTDPTAPPHQEQQFTEFQDDLDKLFEAVQLYSYPGQYVVESPSVHRIAETILKLEEDVLGKASYLGPRSVHVHFGEPVEIAEFLQKNALDMKNAARPLTVFMSTRIQVMLEEMGRERNRHLIP
ncbi:MAG: 1-acyl-sn-glycerol-3-phosphate acyltransferase [Opitutales bacterium]